MQTHGLDLDTIAAIATPLGRGSISIIRISGPGAKKIAQKLTHKSVPTREPIFSVFFNPQGEKIDDGIVLFFEAPFSFTGEDTAELQGHGGVVVAQMVLESCLNHGARMARPGEFSERAFMNDKIDLIQAEAIADLIDANTPEAAKRASASVSGSLSENIENINQSIIKIRAYVEAAIDFPEEEVDFLNVEEILDQLSKIYQQLLALYSDAQQGAIVNQGASIVLTGKPNVGKSSLLNRLVQDNVAIVSNVPGTTRDVVKHNIDLNGILIQISDTAGIRDQPDDIEEEGIKRALYEISQADLVINVLDDLEPFEADLAGKLRDIYVFNKVDLTNRPAGITSKGSLTGIGLSALTGEGIVELKEAVLSKLGVLETGSKFSARSRHIAAIEEAGKALAATIQQFTDHAAAELLAEDLRQIHTILGSLTGKFATDDLLDEIFSSFCIGK